MKYQIIGAAKLTKETKTGKHFRTITILNPNPVPDYEGLDAERITLWDKALEVTSVETYNGKFYDVKDGKDYWIDIDYDRNGWIVAARVYNG